MKTKQSRQWRAIVNNKASQFINKLGLLLDKFMVDAKRRFVKWTDIV